MGKRSGIRIGATVGMIAGLYSLWKSMEGASGSEVPARAVIGLTGYNYLNGTWDWKKATAAIPMLAGAGLSMVASKTGINRYTPKGINL